MFCRDPVSLVPSEPGFYAVKKRLFTIILPIFLLAGLAAGAPLQPRTPASLAAPVPLVHIQVESLKQRSPEPSPAPAPITAPCKEAGFFQEAGLYCCKSLKAGAGIGCNPVTSKPGSTPSKACPAGKQFKDWTYACCWPNPTNPGSCMAYAQAPSYY